MTGRLTKIGNGTVITTTGLLEGGCVVVKDGRILEIMDHDIFIEGAEFIDARGSYISPGFIDIHVHGGGGFDFMDATETAFLNVAKTHARYGTTAMLPTTLSGSKQSLLEVIDIYESVKAKNISGSQFLGLHLEGPYFAMTQRGAQDPRYIRDPDPEEYREILARTSSIRRWSAAPELKGAIEFAKYLKSRNVLPALAHTDAIYEEVIEAFDNGYTLATHLYSAMSGVTRRNAFRYAGVIESAFLIDDMDVEIIADGIHLPAPLLKLVYKIKGPDRIALITDAMRAAGMPPGESWLGSLNNGLKVIVEDGVAKLPDRSAFAGSVATANRLVKSMVKLADVNLVDAVTMASTTPARIIGVSDSKGSLTRGKDADIVIFDRDYNVHLTMICRNIVFNDLPRSEKEN